MQDLEPNLPWWRADRPWGFRFSAFDAAVMLGGAIVIAWSISNFPELAWITAFTLGHFLLFCNTFRVGGVRELAWMFVFAMNFATWLFLFEPALVVALFPWILLGQIPVTIAILASSLFSRDYHGIACERINPHGYRMGAQHGGLLAARLLKRWGVPDRVVEVLTGKNAT